MKTKVVSLFILTSLLFAACSSSGAQATETAPIPTVVADNTLIAEGRVEPIQYAEIAFTASGIVSEVLVDEGQQVKKGQPLVRLGGESDTAYTAAQLELVTAQQALNDLLNSSGAELAQVVIRMKDEQEAYDKADDYLRFLQNSQKVPQSESRVFLVPSSRGYEYRFNFRNFKGPAPKDWITEAENDLALKKAELEEDQRAYERMKEGADKDQLAVLEARLNAAKARVAAFAVIAPFDGVIAELNAKTGNSINAGEIAVTVADFSKWLVKTTDLTELDVVNIEQGQSATITFDAIPDATLNGKIKSISQTFEEKQGDVVYEVTVALTDEHPDLRWGMTAIVKFEK